MDIRLRQASAWQADKHGFLRRREGRHGQDHRGLTSAMIQLSLTPALSRRERGNSRADVLALGNGRRLQINHAGSIALEDEIP
jgi:hypothetical protein